MLTVVLGAGIIADIATPAERGGFFGVFGVGPIVCAPSPCLEQPVDFGNRLALVLDLSSEECSPKS
jgi:hypothetical protein